MQVNELRIGNILYTTKILLDNNSFSTSENDYRPVYVSGIDGDNLRDSDGYWYYIDYFKPIPLTEDWLLKFGFNMTNTDYLEYSWEYRKNDYQTGLFTVYNALSGYSNPIPSGNFYLKTGIEPPNDMSDYGYPLSEYKQIEYVHQLQNLYFALTGEELTIKKPTV